jgi:hypothetical protein
MKITCGDQDYCIKDIGKKRQNSRQRLRTLAERKERIIKMDNDLSA